MLAIGSKAPDFKLNSTPDQQLSLHELKGKKVIIAFYPADWSPVCSDQMGLINQSLRLFDKYNAIAIGISVDSKWSHLAFSQDRNFHFPILADFEPKGEVSKMYDAYNTEDGVSERVLYLIDEEGIILWSYKSPVGINPGVDGILDALESANSVK